MQRIQRPRRYVSALQLYAMMPVLRYSYERGAYVLRVVGESRGPVLRKDRRRYQRAYNGSERRLDALETAIDPALTSRPVGGVRVLDRAQTRGRDPSPRRPQHGRQRPPRPRH
ncbi:MAG: hypothetical protein ACJ780_32040 [Solirubrobacteraceae bacterium]